ncbi:MAG: hypothetical protein HY923_06050 [Elusimicrobia bacterium]|nr:hypothetical protein [Elusimicrobiota bacterium]
MPEQPEPEPQKAKPQAAPKASSSSGADVSPASAYVPLPGAPKPKSRAVLALAALIAAGALGGAALYFKGPSGPPPGVVAAVQEKKVLFVSDADVNVAATKRLRESGAPAVANTMGAGGPVKQAAPPLPVAPPELVNPPASAPQSALTPQGQAAVRADGYSIFSMQLIDDVAQDGDVVQISVDGVPVSFLSLTHAGATLDIPLKKGESHVITVTGVRDGTGGITLGLRTSVGDVTSRNLAVGESESWTIGFK